MKTKSTKTIGLRVAPKQWIVMSVPGRDDDNDASWFAYNKGDRRTVRAKNCDDARRLVRELNHK